MTTRTKAKFSRTREVQELTDAYLSKLREDLNFLTEWLKFDTRAAVRSENDLEGNRLTLGYWDSKHSQFFKLELPHPFALRLASLKFRSFGETVFFLDYLRDTGGVQCVDYGTGVYLTRHKFTPEQLEREVEANKTLLEELSAALSSGKLSVDSLAKLLTSE